MDITDSQNVPYQFYCSESFPEIQNCTENTFSNSWKWSHHFLSPQSASRPSRPRTKLVEMIIPSTHIFILSLFVCLEFVDINKEAWTTTATLSKSKKGKKDTCKSDECKSAAKNQQKILVRHAFSFSFMFMFSLQHMTPICS